MSVPHYNAVGGDLIIASKSLAMLGWSAPAALTARVAIERGLIELNQHYHTRLPERPTVGTLVDRLYRKRKWLAPNLRRCMPLYRELSDIAHGADVNLADTVELVLQADEIVSSWRVPAVV